VILTSASHYSRLPAEALQSRIVDQIEHSFATLLAEKQPERQREGDVSGEFPTMAIASALTRPVEHFEPAKELLRRRTAE